LGPTTDRGHVDDNGVARPQTRFDAAALVGQPTPTGGEPTELWLPGDGAELYSPTQTFGAFAIAESSIARATFEYLTSVEWVRASENFVLVGPAETGKGHALIALAHTPIEAGFRVRCFAAASLADALYQGLADNSVGRLIEGLRRADLLIVDDLRFAPLDRAEAQFLFRRAHAGLRLPRGGNFSWPQVGTFT